MNKTTFTLALMFVSMTLNAVLNGQSISDTRISMYGLALPKSQVTLRSAIDSHVRVIHVAEGQDVRKGDLLVELDSRTALASRDVAKLVAEEIGSRSQAEAELEYATDFMQRVRELHSQNAMNDRDLKDARLRLQRAKAAIQVELERAKANQARFILADAELQKYYLRAPFDGRVSRLALNQGDSVISTTDILELIALDELRVELFLPLKQANDLSLGQACKLEVQSPFEKRQPVVGKVVFRSPMIEATTGTLRVVFEIDNRQQKLPAGFTVSLLEATPTVLSNEHNDYGQKESARINNASQQSILPVFLEKNPSLFLPSSARVNR